MKDKKVFLTGITGFVGSNLGYALLHSGHRVTSLVRPVAGGPPVRQRALDALAVAGDPGSLPLDRLQLIEGDITDDLTPLAGRVGGDVDEVWHCAVLSKHGERDRDELWASNVDGTRNVLDLAPRLNVRRVPSFMHMSTAYVCGRRSGMVPERIEEELPDFHNLYEQSKYEAERLVQSFGAVQGATTVICRPSIVVGHSVTGRALNFAGYYSVIRALYRLRRNLEVNLDESFDGDVDLRVLVSMQCTANLVPVDFLVKAMCQVADRQPKGMHVIHVANEEPPGLPLMLDVVCEDLGIRGIHLVDSRELQVAEMDTAERVFHRSIGFQAPYLRLPDLRFSTRALREFVPRAVLPPPRVDREYFRLVNRVYIEMLDAEFGRSCRSADRLARTIHRVSSRET